MDRAYVCMKISEYPPWGLSNRVDPPYTLHRASNSITQPSVSSQPPVSSWLTGSQTQIQPGESSRTDLTNTNVQSDMDLASGTSEQRTECQVRIQRGHRGFGPPWKITSYMGFFRE